MTKTLQTLQSQLKKARNLTYYGKYPQALSAFDSIQTRIEGQLFHISDHMLLTKWNQFLEEIKYEKLLVQTTCEMLTGKADVKIPTRQQKQSESLQANVPLSGNNSSRRLNNNGSYKQDEVLQRKPKMPFGKQPFRKKVHQDDQVYNKKQKQRRRQQQQQRRRQQSQQQRRQQNSNNNRSGQKPTTPPNANNNNDDQVWQQIFPKQKPLPRIVAKKNTSYTSGSGGSKNTAQNNSLVGGGDKQRDYEKPWRKNAAKTKDEKKEGGGKDDDKKTFLKSVYPDGNGPDTNLIQALQRQVVDLHANITFDDIAQLTKAKQILQQAVLLPLALPHIFVGNRRAWKGVLLFGPPGTGKTLLAKAVASTGATTFFNVTASSIASKWRGQSQKMIRLLFQMARFYAPTTIFIDEIDSLASARGEKEDQASRRVKTELMTRIDGCTTGADDGKLITVIGATNRPWDLDQAIRRRLQKRIYIPLPTEIGRRQLLRINLKNQKTQNVDLQQVVRRTQGYSGADIANLCRQAAYMPMRRKLKNEGGLGRKLTDPTWKEQFEKAVNIPLTMDDFYEALKNVKPSVGQGDLKNYMEWMAEFGEQGTK